MFAQVSFYVGQSEPNVVESEAKSMDGVPLNGHGYQQNDSYDI